MNGSLQVRVEDTVAMEMVVILMRRIICVKIEMTGQWRKRKTNAG